MKKIVLASKSPRRKELLEQIDIEYECIPAVGEEKISPAIDEKLYEKYKDFPAGTRLFYLQYRKQKRLQEK